METETNKNHIKDELTTTAMIACSTLAMEWNETNMKAAIVSIIDMLKECDDELGNSTYIQDRKRLTVKFVDRGFAKCAPWSGRLEFGPNILENALTAESFGYTREKIFIRRRCKTRIQGMIWLVLHEYCHLFRDRVQHRKSFYEFVDSKFEKFFKNF